MRDGVHDGAGLERNHRRTPSSAVNVTHVSARVYEHQATRSPRSIREAVTTLEDVERMHGACSAARTRLQGD